MASNRSITSACTGLSYVPTDTPRSVRYSTRKTPPSVMFSDSETPRSRPRRSTRHIGSPYHHHHHQQQTYATLTLKQPNQLKNLSVSSKKINDDIDKLSTNEHLRDFIQVLDSFAQEKFGGNESLQIASSPTETNDSGYQSSKQFIHSDEYAVVVKPKPKTEQFRQRRRSYSSNDHNEHYCT